MCLYGEVRGSVIGADAAFVVAEDYVHHPVEAVLIAQWLRMTGPS